MAVKINVDDCPIRCSTPYDRCYSSLTMPGIIVPSKDFVNEYEYIDHLGVCRFIFTSIEELRPEYFSIMAKFNRHYFYLEPESHKYEKPPFHINYVSAP